MLPEQDARAIARMRQLAAEVRFAVGADDVEAVCRVAALLPDAVEAARREVGAGAPGLQEAAAELHAANDAAEAFLREQMRKVSARLSEIGSGGRATSAYTRRGGGRMVDGRL